MSGGGKNNRLPLLTGVHHVTVPASDPLAASDWYVRVFDFAALLMEKRENEVVAVLLQHPCGGSRGGNHELLPG
jgi:catechol 2,3-dioxygenase-like lactoylglutathione lyase family enzyme